MPARDPRSHHLPPPPMPCARQAWQGDRRLQLGTAWRAPRREIERCIAEANVFAAIRQERSRQEEGTLPLIDGGEQPLSHHLLRRVVREL
eukprot:scaffold3009_cov108-Isochrysis_galbana.AAC.2